MQFQDDLAAGIVLVRPALRSPNYAAGSAGWSVAVDGTAEFNNVVVRGTVVAMNAAGATATLTPDAPSGISDATAPGLQLSMPTGDTTPAGFTEFDDTFSRGLYIRTSSPLDIASSGEGVDYASIRMEGRFHGSDPRIVLSAGSVPDAPNGEIVLNGTFLDASGTIIAYGGGWTTYTPSMANSGGATFSTRTGYWRRIGDGVEFVAYFVVNGAGSGAGNITVTAPVSIDRTTRQRVSAHLESMTAGNNGSGTALAFQGGSGNVFDRIRNSTNGTVTGADVLNGAIITVQGWVREG